MKHYTNKPEV